MIDLDKIKKLAKAATPGTWDAVLHAHGTGVENDDEQLFIEQYGLTYTANPSDALFIAAANPGAILELIERVRKAEASIVELEGDLRLRHRQGVSQGRIILELETRITEAAKLHRPVEGIHGWLVCSHRHCVDDSQDQCAWPCETAVALGMNEGSET